MASVLFYMYAEHSFEEYLMTEKALENLQMDHVKRYKPQLSSISEAD
jgi:hypothetical protein